MTELGEATDTERRAFATSRIKAAFLGSLTSKAGTAILQLLAIPYAMHMLRPEQGGLYAAVTNSVGWIATASLAYGPSLTLMIAEAVSQKDQAKEVRAFSSNFFINLIFIVFVLLGLGVYFGAHAPAQEFAANFPRWGTDVSLALVAAVLIGVLVLMLTTFEIARDGYQETGITARSNLIGTLLAVLLVPVGVYFTHSIAVLVVTLLFVPCLGRIWACGRMVLRERPYLMPRWSAVSKDEVRRIVFGNGAYSLVQLGSYANANLSVLLIAKLVGLPESGAMFLMFVYFMQGVTLITQVTQPIVPSLREGVTRGDHAWTRRVLLKFVGLATGASLAIGVGLALVCPWFVAKTLPSYSMPSLLPWVFGLQFALFAMEFVLTNAIVSVWRILPPSLVVLGRTVVSTSLLFLLVPKMHEVGASLALVIGMAATSAWMLPVMLSFALKRLETPTAGEA